MKLQKILWEKFSIVLFLTTCFLTLPLIAAGQEKIVFRSQRDANSEIYVMNPDGSNQTRLINNPAVDSDPSWGRLKYQFSLFDFSDLLLPNNQITEVDAGSSVPVSFSLGGFKGLNIYSSPPASRRINCITGLPVGAVQPINRTLPDPFYNAAFDFYTTTWLTQAQWAGTCRRLMLNLDDGSKQKLDFYFQ